jgi:hypothetical protein
LSKSVRGYHFYHIRSAQNSLLHRQPDIAKRNAGRYGHAWVHAALRLWRKNDLRYLLTCVHSITCYNNTLTQTHTYTHEYKYTDKRLHTGAHSQTQTQTLTSKYTLTHLRTLIARDKTMI